MTQKSQEILRQTSERRHRNDRMLVKGFTDEETKELNRLLGMVYRNMQSEEFLQER